MASDRFNHPQNKQNLTQFLALKKKHAEITLDDVTALPPRRLPQAKANAKNYSGVVYQAANNKQLKMLDPLVVREVIDVDSSKVFPALFDMNYHPEENYYYSGRKRSDEDVKVIPSQLKLPIGENFRLPFYKPPTFAESYDVYMMKQLIHYYYIRRGVFPTDKDAADYSKEVTTPDEEADSFFADAVAIASTTYFGTPLISGQIKRLVDSRDIHYGLNGKFAAKSIYDLNLNFEKVSEILEKTLPLPDVGMRVLQKLPSKHYHFYEDRNISGVKGYRLLDLAPPFTLSTAPGQPYSMGTYKTKGDALWSSVAIADAVCKFVNSQIVGQIQVDMGKLATSFTEKFGYLTLNNIFGKAERYKIDPDLMVPKGRNIFSMPFAAHILGMLFESNVAPDGTLIDSPLNFTNFDTPSAYKFSAYHGGMNTLCDKIIKNEKFELIYSDNLWIFDTESWHSLDLEKGEANAEITRVQAHKYYNITRRYLKINSNGELNININNTYLFIGLVILPLLQCKATGVLGNARFEIPGQSSGNTGTFANNHTTTSIFWHFWRQMKQPHPDSDEFKTVAKLTGVNIKLERSIPDPVRKLLNCRNEAVELEEYVGFPPNKQLPQVDLDFLGWSAVCVKINGTPKFVPVLDPERFHKTCLFPSPVPKRFRELANTVITSTFALVQNFALWCIGGFHYKLYRRLIIDRHEHHRVQLRKALQTLNIFQEQLQDVARAVIEGLNVPAELSNDLNSLIMSGHQDLSHLSLYDLFTETPQETPVKSLRFVDKKMKQVSWRITQDVLSLKKIVTSKFDWANFEEDEEAEDTYDPPKELVSVLKNNIFADKLWFEQIEKWAKHYKSKTQSARKEPVPDVYKEAKIGYRGSQITNPKKLEGHKAVTAADLATLLNIKSV